MRAEVILPRTKVKALGDLWNVGRAMLGDFRVLGIGSVDELARREPDALYAELQERTGQRHDPWVRDVFAATIHEARTGEALDWWKFTPERKARKR